jgi:AcrR family transcriptional regulator
MLICNGVASPPSTEDRILDATRLCVAEFGVKRTTLAEVARRAGVSRPTVYRRWPDTRTLIADLLTREIAATIDVTVRADQPVRAQLVAAVLDGVRAIGASPLFEKLFRTDSDLMLTYIVERLGRSQRVLLSRFAAQITAGQADGSIRTGDPADLAAMVLLITQSCAQSARMVAADLPPDRLRHELAVALHGYLRPGPHSDPA